MKTEGPRERGECQKTGTGEAEKHGQSKLSDEAQKGQKRSSAPERQGPAQRKNIANVRGVKSCKK